MHKPTDKYRNDKTSLWVVTFVLTCAVGGTLLFAYGFGALVLAFALVGTFALYNELTFRLDQAEDDRQRQK